MLTKNEIKGIQSLYHKKERDEQQLFIAEGPKLAEELILAGVDIEHVYATAKWKPAAQSRQYPITEISEIELGRISQLQTPNEVVVVARQNKSNDEPIYDQKLTLVLDGIQDPGNLGTILRIADWFGLSQIICSTDCADMYNAKVVQSTMGSIIRIKCWYKDFATWPLPENIPVYGALLEGENIFTLEQKTGGLLVIGNESKGIRNLLTEKITRPVTIPRLGGAESLNAAVAAGIIIAQLTAAT